MEKKKTIILSAIAGLTLVILLVGATYAYFQATGGAGASSNIKVETATTDLLTFNFSKSIAIYADQSNFGQNAGSKSDSTKGTATLTASNSPNIESTTDRYNIYFIIEANDFVYTTSDNKTEILLQVTDSNGNEVTAIDGLLYKDGGFDITTRTGGFLLVPDYDISATRGNTTTQEWNIKVTLVNLDTDQSENMGKAFNGKLYMTKDQMSSYELSQIKNMNVTTTYNSIDTSLEVTNGSAEIEKYYFANEKVSSNTTSMLSINKLAVSDVTFVETTNANYKFTNLDANSTYKIYSYAVDKNGIKTNMYETEVKTDKYVVPTVDSVTHSSTLNSITVNVSASKGSNEVVKYYYSKDNGETYEESTEPSYTFNNLADSAEYKIRIKVEDSEGKFSTIYSENISTVTYTLPSITTVTTTTKYNQITITTTAKGGTNSVSKYYYSINNGAYVEDTSTHTFTGLSEQTTYTIKVKVVDTNNRESVEYVTSAKTDVYKLPAVTITSTSSTSDSITINVSKTNGDGTVTTYYYSKDNGSSYVSSTSSSYTFSNLTSNATFYIKVYVKDSNGRSSSVVSTSIATEQDLAYHQSCNDNSLACTVAQTYESSDIEDGLVYHDENLDNGANDKSYRFVGENPNNYVCFGSTSSSCPKDNLYRIIGIFDGQVKLIKSDFASKSSLGTNGNYIGTSSTEGVMDIDDYRGSLSTIYVYSYNNNDSSKKYSWSDSNLNLVNLNTNYINNIGSTWTDKIATTTWNIGIISNATSGTAPEIYTSEISNPDDDTTYDDKIGLMYVSDYAYAISPSKWTTKVSSYSYNHDENNWMWIGTEEWTIAKYSTSGAVNIKANGKIGGYAGETPRYGIRPVFYLESSTEFSKGSGTSSNPYRLS